MLSRTCSLSLCLLLMIGPAWWFDGDASAQSPNVSLSQLETNAAAQPLGIDDRTPRFSWALNSKRRGISQTAFRILVASKPDLAREGKADIWDSKQVRNVPAGCLSGEIIVIRLVNGRFRPPDWNST